MLTAQRRTVSEKGLRNSEAEGQADRKPNPPAQHPIPGDFCQGPHTYNPLQIQYTGAPSGTAPTGLPARGLPTLVDHVSQPMPCFRHLCAIAATFVLLTSFGSARANDVTDIADLFHSGKQTEAMAKIDTLLGEKSDRPDLRFLKGVLLVEARRVDEALPVFQTLTEEFPELPEPYNNLAALYAARGDFEKARAALDGALRANPGFAIAHENLGDVYAQLARASYQRALKLDPGNTTIPPRLALLRELTEPSARKPAR